jgi:hypothetical protein
MSANTERVYRTACDNDASRRTSPPRLESAAPTTATCPSTEPAYRHRTRSYWKEGEYAARLSGLALATSRRAQRLRRGPDHICRTGAIRSAEPRTVHIGRPATVLKFVKP